jgi:hypothetical protein
MAPAAWLTLAISINALYISKGLINPLIYAARVPDIRAALQRMCPGYWQAHKHPEST